MNHHSDPTQYARRFGGIERLYGAPAALALRQAHVCVAGVGGVGSWAVEALARSGVGALTLIDLDNVAPSNANRQIHALTDQFGRPKVDALAERIGGINPECRVTCIEEFVDEDNAAELLAKPFDFVIDAVDQVRAKAAMAALLVGMRRPFVVSGGAGGQRNPALIRTADLSQTTHDPLLSSLRYTLRRRYGFARGGAVMRVPCIYSLEQPVPPQNAACGTAPQGLSCAGYGACMTVTAAFGLYCAQAAVEQIVRRAC